jgi:hypothetical protein
VRAGIEDLAEDQTKAKQHADAALRQTKAEAKAEVAEELAKVKAERDDAKLALTESVGRVDELEKDVIAPDEDENEESPTREELKDALASAVEEIEALKARVASLERSLGLTKLLLNLPRRPRRVTRTKNQEEEKAS